MRIERKELTVNGIRTPIDWCSPSNKLENEEAVIFVHGNPGSSKDWEAFIPHVGKFANAVAPDMPGYGKADRPSDFSYTVEGYAQHLYSLTNHLGIKTVHLVLHDFGGPWGLQFAANHPDMVKSIVLVNTGLLPEYKWHTYARIWRTPILGELFQALATRCAFRMLLNRDNPKPFPEEFTDRMFNDSDWGLSKGMLKLYRSVASLADFSMQLGTSLKVLNLPALVLWGENDKYMPVRFAEIQKDYFDTKIYHLPNCGHWPMIDNPELITSYLIPFLEKQYLKTNHQ